MKTRHGIFIGLALLFSCLMVNHRLTRLERGMKTLNNRTTGLNYEIGWLQDRIDVLEIPELPQKVINVDNVMQSVVHIGASGNYGDWQGSGVYVGNGLILTAGHVIDGADTFVVTFENSQSSYASSVTYLEPTTDVGFIYLEDYDGPALVFDNDGYGRGDVTYIFGNPFGYDYKFSVSKGIISSMERDCDGFFGEKIMLQSDAAGFPGVSGGPVTDEEGEIIGICVGGVPGGISLIIPGLVCKQVMEIYLNILELKEMK